MYSTIKPNTVLYSTASEVISLPPAEVEAVSPLVRGEAALLAHPATVHDNTDDDNDNNYSDNDDDDGNDLVLSSRYTRSQVAALLLLLMGTSP